MSRDVIAPRGGTLLRGLPLWSGVTLAACALPALLDEEVAAARTVLTGTAAGIPFDSLLAAACALALCACAAWAWLVTTATLALACAGSTHRVPGCPDAVRRLVLAACGLATVVATAPAQAEPPQAGPGSTRTGAATDLDVDRTWRALWAANRAVVGPDPDLIHPGTLLRRPTPKEHP